MSFSIYLLSIYPFIYLSFLSSYMSFSIYLSIYPCIYLSVLSSLMSFSIYLFIIIYLPIYLFIHLSIYLYLYIYLSIYPSIYLSNLSIYPFDYPSWFSYLSILLLSNFLSIPPSIHLSIIISFRPYSFIFYLSIYLFI